MNRQELCRKIILFCICWSGAVFFLAGCGGSSDATRWKQEAPDFSSSATRDRQTPIVSGTYKPHARKGKLTILLAQYREPRWIQMSQDIIARLRNILQTQDIWTVEEPMGLTIYYGHFRTEAQAKKEFSRVKRLYKQMKLGAWQFPYIKEIPAPDPPAPSAWHIFNSHCAYTLEIGVYYDQPERKYYNRKEDAVKAVAELRKAGEIAYYLHGPQNSFVYVGCFGRGEVQVRKEGGKRIINVSPRVRDLQKKYPYHYEEGAKVYDIIPDATGKKHRIARTSAIIDVEKLWYELPH